MNQENAAEMAFDVKIKPVMDPMCTKENIVEKSFDCKSELQHNNGNNSVREVSIKEEPFSADLVSKC